MDRATYYRLFQRALDDMKYLSHQLNEDALFAGIDEECSGEPVVGIDLGTTNSCCAVVKDGKPVVIPSRMGYTTIPSVIAVDSDGSVDVGHAAFAKMEINPQRTVYGSKRLVGRPFDSPVVQEVRNRFLYKIVPGVRGLAAVEIDGRKFGLEEVSGLILEELRRMAEEFLEQSVSRAVISVPAYYNENQRLSVRQAGAMAGLKVERILNEPTSAALAYGHLRGKSQRILVYDLGGGTFDVSVMNLTGAKYEVLATGGDTFLGGVDFDGLLMDHLIEEYRRKQGKTANMDRFNAFRVLNVAEAAKKNLSDVKSALARFAFWSSEDNKSIDFEAKVTRKKLEELVLPLVGKTLETCDQVLKTSRTNPDELDVVLLVGGQTRMPLIWRMIANHMKKKPHKGVHPDEAVAVGAALLADAMNRRGSVQLVDVLPMSIGIGVTGGKFKKLLPAGNSIDLSRTYSISTFLPDQDKMFFPIFQGESENVLDNELLGVFYISGIPPGPEGSRRIELTFSLTPECLLKVSAKDREAGPLGKVTLLAHEILDVIHSSTDENFQRLDILDVSPPVSDEKKPGLLKKLFTRDE
jgi:molecular chaperone DnaK